MLSQTDSKFGKKANLNIIHDAKLATFNYRIPLTLTHLEILFRQESSWSAFESSVRAERLQTRELPGLTST